MPDRFIVNLVDMTNRVRAQSLAVAEADVPDVVAYALKGAGQFLPAAETGWTVIVCRQETALNLHFTPEELAAVQEAERRKAG